MKDILTIIVSFILLISIGFNIYLVVFNQVDHEELAVLRLENNATKTEAIKYKGLIESSKIDCDLKIASAKKLWENNQDVKNDIENSDGGMVTFELGGVR